MAYLLNLQLVKALFSKKIPVWANRAGNKVKLPELRKNSVLAVSVYPHITTITAKMKLNNAGILANN
jgi:hypothetical protein